MVGLEQLEIHSKSYIVRWIRVEDGHSISWSIKPHKKSINFGIIKHPGLDSNELSGTLLIEDASNFSAQVESGIDKYGRPSNLRKDSSTAQEQLKAKGFIVIQWYGKCEADKVFMGTHAVSTGLEGMYGLIFDNTFSKQLSKTATLVMLTFPTNVPPKSSDHHFNSAALTMGTKMSGSHKQNNFSVSASRSVDNLQNKCSNAILHENLSRVSSMRSQTSHVKNMERHVGVLSKKRRKKGQGFARRFFSLNFATCTLSYYYNRNSSALRGAIPLSLAAITADKRKREINIDAGAEIWHLKAENSKDFQEWTKALEQASKTALGINSKSKTFQNTRSQTELKSSQSTSEGEREWEQVEALVSRIVDTRDAIDRLFKETDPCELRSRRSGTLGIRCSKSSHSISGEEIDYFNQVIQPEKKAFWKRKCSSNSSQQLTSRSPLEPNLFSVTNTTGNEINSSSNSSTEKRSRSQSYQDLKHDHSSALLSDLNKVLNDFSLLLAKRKRRREISAATNRNSFDSNSTSSNTEFFDAESGHLDHSQVYTFPRQIQDESLLSDPDEVRNDFITDALSMSSTSNHEILSQVGGVPTIFPTRPKTLDPLPVTMYVQRRELVPPAVVMPPSLISLLRKNVGKDLSTVSMPVSANEPTSLLQRTAEQFEYAQLLDKASQQELPDLRLCFVAAFTVSSFSINRCKERALRKPFNPMLGETYELLRTEDEIPGGFRFLAEKVSHRPVRIACQADSRNWSVSQSPAPTNKFWGKSAEIITEGRVRVVLHLSNGHDELYSWSVASACLRNVVVGEKYVEPVGSTTIVNESTGAKAIINFKNKGIFGGRSEDVEVKFYGKDGKMTCTSLVGAWTKSLRIVESGKATESEIWHVGQLIENPTKRYGLTKFAAGLNEITQIEEEKIPVTDCRLRPDQRAVENGNLDEAERIKEILEEKQRIRRKKMEENGEVWKPRWFFQIEGGDEGEEVWKLRSGKEGYWEERAQGTWTGIISVLSPS